MSDNDGYKQLAGFHDATLIGVDLNSASTRVALSFRTESGALLELLLVRPILFRVSDLGLQNVVSRILLFSGPHLDERVAHERLTWATSTTSSATYLKAGDRSRFLERLKASEVSLIWIDPSCGAELVAVVSGVEQPEVRDAAD